jgi:hypothetical protein
MTKLISSFALAMTTLFAFLVSAAAGAQNLTPQCIEGVYTLDEFKRTDGQVFKPPQISGRWMVLNGAVMWIFYDRTRPSAEISYSGLGRYTVNATSFAYRYDELSIYTHSNTGISVFQPLAWEGMRLFTRVIEQDGLHLRNIETQTEFFCSADEIKYNDWRAGIYYRYLRVKSD